MPKLTYPPENCQKQAADMVRRQGVLCGRLWACRDRSLENAARTLGSSEIEILWRVTLPLARPGILAGAALVLLTVLKELPLTLMLAPTGFDTLATGIWSATSEAFYARAALPALLLLAVSSLSVAIILSQDRAHD
jgi:iron(III) transport system permease protein